MELQIFKTKKPKKKPEGNLVFGTCFTDHMLIMEYSDFKWHSARIEPYAPFSLDPASSVFHYGQAVFEGAKAFKNEKGEVRIFRLDENIKRLNTSCERMCIPKLDEKFVLESIERFVLTESEWIPTAKDTSLYLRPTIIAVEQSLGVHSSNSYIFYCIASPVGAYYSKGLKPVSLYVENEYVRAAVGGTGAFKAAGNYAASLKAGERAEKMGCDQVMWLDAINRKYVEEVGSMNIMFVIDGKVITPPLTGSILPGITRKSVIQLLKARNIELEERLVSIDELAVAAKNGSLTEIFGTGTAAAISFVGSFVYNNETYNINNGKMGEISMSVYKELTAIQTGRTIDRFNWVKVL